jgi:hypothetical protein
MTIGLRLGKRPVFTSFNATAPPKLCLKRAPNQVPQNAIGRLFDGRRFSRLWSTSDEACQMSTQVYAYQNVTLQTNPPYPCKTAPRITAAED